MKFDNDYYIMITLGMSGKFIRNDDKHNNIEFVMKKYSIFFNDSRNFGTIKFTKSFEDIENKLNRLGPDILDNSTTCEIFKNQLRKSDKKISLVLMNQKIISGIGNYLTSEILWYAKISPHRTINSLNDNDIKKIYKSMNKIIKKMYNFNKKKKSLNDTNFINDYKQGDFVVYRKKIDPFGNKIKSEKIGGRTKWWVPGRQN